MSSPYVGEIRITPFTFAPKGWAFCNGQLISRTQNSVLFQVAGTNFGAGDGVSTFQLPDLRERFPLGCGAGRGLTPHPIGESGGEASIVLTADQISHAHTLLAVPNAATLADPTGVIMAQASSSLGNIYRPATNLVPMNANSVLPVGSGQPHENRSPYLSLNFVIALSGVFPAQ